MIYLNYALFLLASSVAALILFLVESFNSGVPGAWNEFKYRLPELSYPLFFIRNRKTLASTTDYHQLRNLDLDKKEILLMFNSTKKLINMIGFFSVGDQLLFRHRKYSGKYTITKKPDYAKVKS